MTWAMFLHRGAVEGLKSWPCSGQNTLKTLPCVRQHPLFQDPLKRTRDKKAIKHIKVNVSQLVIRYPVWDRFWEASKIGYPMQDSETKQLYPKTRGYPLPRGGFTGGWHAMRAKSGVLPVKKTKNNTMNERNQEPVGSWRKRNFKGFMERRRLPQIIIFSISCNEGQLATPLPPAESKLTPLQNQEQKHQWLMVTFLNCRKRRLLRNCRN